MNKKLISAVFLISLVAAAFWGCKGKSSAEIFYDEVPVHLAGGSGKTTLQSPAVITRKNNKTYIQIVFNSSNYDYVIVDGKKYLNENNEGNSTFTIPIKNFTDSFSIIADTVAMSRPHEIEYVVALGENEIYDDEKVIPDQRKKNYEPLAMEKSGDISFQYANQIKIEKYGTYRLITITDIGRFFVVPEDKEVPESLPSDITVLKQPLNNCYMVSTSAMDFAVKLNVLNMFRYSSLKAQDWFIPEAKQAMTEGNLIYAGKYNTPDYERLFSENCTLALENSMIFHNPETKEKLEELGIPVLIERSTYEGNPFGRLEWIKLYGTLFGLEGEAAEFYNRQIQKVSDLINNPTTGKTVSYFHVTSNGAVNVRKPGDYIARLIEMAGGVYEPSGITDVGSSTSTASLQMESFYATCLNSDILIYNGTIDSSVQTKKDLLAKDRLFGDFKAYKNGKIFFVDKRLYQETTGLADFLLDLNKILNDDESNLVYLKRLK